MLPHLNLHNTYLNCLARSGIVYLLLVLALLCTLVRPALRMLTRPDPSRLGLFFAPAFVCMILCMSVPENMLFVLCDNRDAARDSRYADFGFVSEDAVIGRVIACFHPPF